MGTLIKTRGVIKEWVLSKGEVFKKPKHSKCDKRTGVASLVKEMNGKNNLWG
jgi:hypothetical protein